MLNVEELLSPYREVLRRNLEQLKMREDVIAIGLAGSVARGDIWPGSDIDIEVIVKGDRPKEVVCTEQEVPEGTGWDRGISVDFAYFGESRVNDVPFDTVPLYDPTGVLTKAIEGRSKDELYAQMIKLSSGRFAERLRKAKEAVHESPHSSLAHLHMGGYYLAAGFTLAAGMPPTVRRGVSRLSEAMSSIRREDIADKFQALYGLPENIANARPLLEELRLGYSEIWDYFKDKTWGPPYMRQQPDPSAWFRNRIEPLYNYDRRDLVFLVYLEYEFVLEAIFRAEGWKEAPANILIEARRFTGPPAAWLRRHMRILGLVPEDKTSSILKAADELFDELKRMGTSPKTA